MKFLISLLFTTPLFATTLSSYNPQTFKYEVLFTNPECKTYNYRRPIKSNSGKTLYSKTKNAYCKSSDTSTSARRELSPHKRLLDWIYDEGTKEIFMAYLSFSNGGIKKALCDVASKKDVKITLVIDSKNLPIFNDGDDSRISTARSLQKCGDVKLHVTGGKGGIGFAHNKLFIVNPSSNDDVKLAFSSANMSSGTTTHHENWHFLNISSKSYFYQSHLCLMEGMLNHDKSKTDFSSHISDCKRKINVKEEEDIKAFFVPGEGRDAMATISQGFKRAKSVDLAAHRFSYGSIVKAIERKLAHSKNSVKLMLDDDMYWTKRLRRGIGRNSTSESYKVSNLERKGLQVHYVETWADDERQATRVQLHHNKFFIFHFSNSSGAVFTGAGNMTSAAFNNNFENFYYITIPSVYDAFKKQYEYAWSKLSLGEDEMPSRYYLP